MRDRPIAATARLDRRLWLVHSGLISLKKDGNPCVAERCAGEGASGSAGFHASAHPVGLSTGCASVRRRPANALQPKETFDSNSQQIESIARDARYRLPPLLTRGFFFCFGIGVG